MHAKTNYYCCRIVMHFISIQMKKMKTGEFNGLKLKKMFSVIAGLFCLVSISFGQPYTIYLTFDDGPLNGSEKIHDAVDKEQIKTTVFVVGVHIDNGGKWKTYFDNYLKDSLIEVGNHSYSHAHNHYAAFYNSPQAVVDDFVKSYEKHSLPTKLCRLPGRNMWRTAKITRNDMKSGSSSADLLFKNGFKVIGWDLEWQHDGKTGTPIQTVDDMVDQISTQLKKKRTQTKNHIVLLCHDEMFAKEWEESELKQLITKLKADGNYRFDFISNYPNL